MIKKVAKVFSSRINMLNCLDSDLKRLNGHGTKRISPLRVEVADIEYFYIVKNTCGEILKKCEKRINHSVTTEGVK